MGTFCRYVEDAPKEKMAEPLVYPLGTLVRARTKEYGIRHGMIIGRLYGNDRIDPSYEIRLSNGEDITIRYQNVEDA